MPVAFVTGSSTGIGYETALHFARNGYTTFATMRDPTGGGAAITEAANAESLPLRVLQLDVDDPASVSTAVADATAQAGPIDVLVNNAGIGMALPIEEATDADLKKVFETNFFGALRVIREVLPSMRERRTGAIVNVTSQGGRVTFQASGPYCATKFALEAASESLAIEVAPFGIRVVIIEPGVVLTPIFRKPGPDAPVESPYLRARRRFGMAVAPLLKVPTLPQECAEVIFDAVTCDEPKLRYTVGSEAAALIANRNAMTDEEWIAIGNIEHDRDFVARISKIWGEKSSAFDV